MAKYEKPDFWSLKAQKEHYPARSVYKLKEIDEKFRLFKHRAVQTPVFRVLDLGAAPGSWSLYVLRKYGKTGTQKSVPSLFLAAVDLLPLSQNFEQYTGEEFFFIQGDFTVSPVKDELIRQGPYHVIMSDAAPPTTGSRAVDTMRSLTLAEEVFSLAESCLYPGGSLAVKIFQGENTAALLKSLRERFESAKSFKPVSCRSNSFETYYVGLGKQS